MNQKLKEAARAYWWALPLAALIVFALVQVFVPSQPLFESRLGTRLNLGLKLDSQTGEPLPVASILQGKLSARDDQSTQHRFVLISLWATWCAPCIKELPRISDARERLKMAGILPLLVNYNSGEKQKIYAEISAWMVAHSVQIPTLYDFSSALTGALDVSALPFSLLLDRNGNILWVNLGEIDDAKIADLIGQFKNK